MPAQHVLHHAPGLAAAAVSEDLVPQAGKTMGQESGLGPEYGPGFRIRSRVWARSQDCGQNEGRESGFGPE